MAATESTPASPPPPDPPPDPPSAPPPAPAKNNRKWIYLTVAIALIGLAIGTSVAFTNSETNADAQHKAQQLKSRLDKAGLPAPEARVIADTFGTDGGVICRDPSNALIKAQYQAAISNGAGGPGQRPVIGDSDVAEAVSLAIATYCPDNLADWLKHVRDDLKLADTTNN